MNAARGREETLSSSASCGHRHAGSKFVKEELAGRGFDASKGTYVAGVRHGHGVAMLTRDDPEETKELSM